MASHAHDPHSPSSDETEEDVHMYDRPEQQYHQQQNQQNRRPGSHQPHQRQEPPSNGRSNASSMDRSHSPEYSKPGHNTSNDDNNSMEFDNAGATSSLSQPVTSKVADDSGSGNASGGKEQFSQQQQQPQQRKPPGSSPSLRKEQNRAAQRAFRDRKERYLQQLENMIKDLKEQHLLVTTRFQKEVLQLTERNATLQSENHYLREVVFAFEAALSKGAAVIESSEGLRGIHTAILQSVKKELFKRHHASKEKELSASITDSGFSTTRQQQQQQPSVETPCMTSTSTLASPSPQSMTATDVSSPPTGLTSVKRGLDFTALEDTTTESPFQPTSVKLRRSNSVISTASSNNNNTSQEQEKGPSVTALQDQNGTQDSSPIETAVTSTAVTSATREVLYRPPPLFIAPTHDEGQPILINLPFESLTVPRPHYLMPGSSLPKVTEYAKHPTVFDELQSSLFPPGTLRSLIQEQMATPQEVVQDNSLFDPRPASLQMKEKDKGKAGTSAQEVLGAQRRMNDFMDTLLSAPPATDPAIDPKVYDIPHDPRIEVVPCPQLRAQLIVHQDKYDMDELFSLVQRETIIHGDNPFDLHCWQLPDSVFTKYPYLWGQDAERHRRKLWPRKIIED
ncbi:hypothetical protein BGZ83_011653 [Gryganskiella cystojenkinii]|nr:hypothetical protein BGZ83_011653 [Gryganskiella cystojenkinii]